MFYTFFMLYSRPIVFFNKIFKLWIYSWYFNITSLQCPYTVPCGCVHSESFYIFISRCGCVLLHSSGADCQTRRKCYSTRWLSTLTWWKYCLVQELFSWKSAHIYSDFKEKYSQFEFCTEFKCNDYKLLQFTD